MNTKFKLKALSVQIGGIVRYKEDGEIFDIEGKHKPLAAEVISAANAGFLEPVSFEVEDDSSEVIEDDSSEIIEFEKPKKGKK